MLDDSLPDDPSRKPPPPEDEDPSDEGGSPDDEGTLPTLPSMHARMSELSVAFRRALDELRPDARRVIELRDFEGLPSRRSRSTWGATRSTP